MTADIRRFTTQYRPAEDRIRVEGTDASEQPIVLWFTHRLLLNVIPLLLKWLEKQTEGSAQSTSTPQGAEIMQSFAQQAALTELVQSVAEQTALAEGKPPLLLDNATTAPQ